MPVGGDMKIKDVELAKDPKRAEGDFRYSSCKMDNNAHWGPYFTLPESLSQASESQNP